MLYRRLSMTQVPLLVFVLGCFGLLTSTVFALMVLAGTRHHLLEPTPRTSLGFTPSLSLLKPLHGAEPGLESSLTSFFEQDYPSQNYEILFCAADSSDAGLDIARLVAARYPHIASRFFTTGKPRCINAKVHSLEVMAASATHGIYVVSDSDVRVTPDYLRAVALPFSDPKIGGMTCLYRGVPAHGGLWARIEAVGMSVEMTAGVLVANMLEGMQFALGPTMAFRRESIQQIGGFAVTADYCSDDFILGNETYRHGWRMALSHHAIDHMVINSSFWSSMQHQVRWMKSTRFSRPKGHFGTGLTFSLPFGLLATAAAIAMGRPNLGAAFLIWSILTRWAIAIAAGRMVVRDKNWLALLVLYPIRDLMGFFFWIASYTSNRILWRGEVFELLPGGRMRAVRGKD
jgi:ceramide glucosyltransferase